VAEPKTAGVNNDMFEYRSYPVSFMYTLGLISFIVTIIGLIILELAFIEMVDTGVGQYSNLQTFVGLTLITIGPLIIIIGYFRLLHSLEK